MPHTKYTLQDAQDLAKSRGGKFLSAEMNRSQDRYEWECAEGHIWMTSFFAVNHDGTWCAKCDRARPERVFGPGPKYSIEDAQKIAEDRGGKLLSTVLNNVKENLTWQCAEKHVWEATFSSVNTCGSWCGSCSGLSCERLTRRMIEFIYGVPFAKAHPPWLKSPMSDRSLELDCYNADIKVALEFQGIQHYTETSFFRHDSLADLQIRDASKALQCAEKGVHLIIVPYTVKHKDLYKFILGKCKSVPDGTPADVPLTTFEATSAKDARFKEICERLAKDAPDITLLSTSYLTAEALLKFKCHQGHTFERNWIASVSKLTSNNHGFCGICARELVFRNKADNTIPKVDAILERLNYHPYPEEHFVGSYAKFDIKCKTCEGIRTVTWNHIKKWKTPCCSQ